MCKNSTQGVHCTDDDGDATSKMLNTLDDVDDDDDTFVVVLILIFYIYKK